MDSLPEHLLNYLLSGVLERLPSESDFVRFSSVCKLWKSIAKENLSKRTRLTGHPLLLAYTGKDGIWNLCDVRKDKVLDVQLELPDKRFCGFSKGWLITMDENFSVTLIDPFSKVKGRKAKDDSIIKLPPLNLLEEDETYRNYLAKRCDMYLYKATISADPVSNAEDYVVMVIHETYCKMAFIRPHTDSEWIYVKAGILDMRDVVYVQDRLYAISFFNQLSHTIIIPGAQLVDLNAISYVQDISINVKFKSYLVEVSGFKEPVMVKRYFQFERDRWDQYKRLSIKFEVFKFDADEIKWTEIHSLGDVALFLGDASTSVVASDYQGCLPNRIYFIHDWENDEIEQECYGERGPRNFGVYNIEDKSFSRIGDAAADLMRKSKRTPIWITANIEL